MADYEVMAHDIVLPIFYDAPVAVPPGWEPISALARQGNNAVLLCRRVIAAPGGPAPVLTSITPNTLLAGSTPATIDVFGSGFDTSCIIYADASPRATFFIDATHLQYTARPDLETSGGTVQISVQGDSGTSNALPFTFT
jgi:IPT/TIG domain-containing protein